MRFLPEFGLMYDEVSSFYDDGLHENQHVLLVLGFHGSKDCMIFLYCDFDQIGFLSPSYLNLSRY